MRPESMQIANLQLRQYKTPWWPFTGAYLFIPLTIAGLYVWR